MSPRGRSESQSIVKQVVVFFAIMLIAAGAGMWFADRYANSNEETEEETPKESNNGESEYVPPPPDPPLYFYSSIQPGSDLEAVIGEVKMAAASGIHKYVMKISLPWSDSDSDMDEMLYPLDRIIEADPEARLVLFVSLNPPDAWLAANPDAAAQTGETPAQYPSVSSETWLNAGKTALGRLIRTLDSTPRGEPVIGIIIGAFENDMWYHGGGYDRSPANTEGFRNWLREQYVDSAVLRSTWGDESLTFETAEIPEKPDTGDTTRVFFEIPSELRQVDYLRYISENTADAILNFAGHIQQASNRIYEIYVPYGHTFELTRNDSGHLALGLMLDAVVDGFVSPVSYSDRGLGGAGGFMGPIDSAVYRGKHWLIVDDTRTGISRDPVSGAIQKIEGLRTEDVLNVQRRNYAAALTHGGGILWADGTGVGSLHEPRMWDAFRRMNDAFVNVWSAPEATSQAGFASYPLSAKRATLSVVVDESSRFFQRCDDRLNTRLLTRLRDCALRAGVPVNFCLLQDVLSGKAAPASVYLFANAFHLDAEDRERLRTLFVTQGSAAIWMYAPGYIDQTASVDNIGATTGMIVRAFDKPTASGSAYQLDGSRWMAKGETFGQAEEWFPLFYIEAEASSSLAKYTQSEQTSVAIRFYEEGWASIYVAEPTITPNLLRELLSILEHHQFIIKSKTDHADTFHFGPRVVAIHANSDGDRDIELAAACDAHDVIDPDVGWLNKQTLTIPMKMGETRILLLTPSVATAEEPASGPDTEPLPAEEHDHPHPEPGPILEESSPDQGIETLP